jgi:glutaredoxin
MKLELYYFTQCPFCQMVLRKIESLKLQDHIQFKNIHEDKGALDFHHKTTGRSTTPCLYIDDKPMFESSDIMSWLDTNAQKIKG